MLLSSDFENAANVVKNRFGHIPGLAMVLGSGLSGIADQLEDRRQIAYKEIPGYPPSTVESHRGRMYHGKLEGVPLLALAGRCHCYEGYTMDQVAFYVGLLYQLGVRRLIITNAAGGVNRDFSVGDLMLITDHIKLYQASPALRAILKPDLSRFYDMTNVYSKRFRAQAERAAAEQGVLMQKGVYMFFAGPQYETPAEIRAARILGADAVGMSTVPEAIAAAGLGMEVLGLSLITNMAAGVSDKPIEDKEVVEAAEKHYGRFSGLLRKIVKMGEENNAGNNDRHCDCRYSGI